MITQRLTGVSQPPIFVVVGGVLEPKGKLGQLLTADRYPSVHARALGPDHA